MSVWTGRVDVADGPQAVRWHQMVRPLASGSPPGIVLIGFACDEGVRRNGGRVGAKDGPRAIRSALANLAWHQQHPVYDAGDVRCDDGDMESAQSQLAELVAAVMTADHRPLVLGGGHETAWGTFQGIVKAKPKAAVGVINIDAHLDLRADEPGNSGTPFYQIARWCAEQQRPFLYQCLGISLASNTAALVDRATELGVRFLPDTTFDPPETEEALITVRSFAEMAEILHLSLDLDVLPASVMPAVSAPAGHGVPLGWVNTLLRQILGLGKTVAVDLVEFNPTLDGDHNSARVAARLAWLIANQWQPGGLS